MRTYLAKQDYGMYEGESILYVGEDKDKAFATMQTINEEDWDQFEVDVWVDGKIIGDYYWDEDENSFIFRSAKEDLTMEQEEETLPIINVSPMKFRYRRKGE